MMKICSLDIAVQLRNRCNSHSCLVSIKFVKQIYYIHKSVLLRKSSLNALVPQRSRLESEEQEESHHEAEEPHGLGQSEPQDGEGEQLALQGRVAGVANHQAAEHAADSSS